MLLVQALSPLVPTQETILLNCSGPRTIIAYFEYIINIYVFVISYIITPDHKYCLLIHHLVAMPLVRHNVLHSVNAAYKSQDFVYQPGLEHVSTGMPDHLTTCAATQGIQPLWSARVSSHCHAAVFSSSPALPSTGPPVSTQPQSAVFTSSPALPSAGPPVSTHPNSAVFSGSPALPGAGPPVSTCPHSAIFSGSPALPTAGPPESPLTPTLLYSLALLHCLAQVRQSPLTPTLLYSPALLHCPALVRQSCHFPHLRELLCWQATSQHQEPRTALQTCTDHVQLQSWGSLAAGTKKNMQCLPFINEGYTFPPPRRGMLTIQGYAFPSSRRCMPYPHYRGVHLPSIKDGYAFSPSRRGMPSLAYPATHIHQVIFLWYNYYQYSKVLSYSYNSVQQNFAYRIIHSLLPTAQVPFSIAIESLENSCYECHPQHFSIGIERMKEDKDTEGDNNRTSEKLERIKDTK